MLGPSLANRSLMRETLESGIEEMSENLARPCILNLLGQRSLTS